MYPPIYKTNLEESLYKLWYNLLRSRTAAVLLRDRHSISIFLFSKSFFALMKQRNQSWYNFLLFTTITNLNWLNCLNQQVPKNEFHSIEKIMVSSCHWFAEEQCNLKLSHYLPEYPDWNKRIKRPRMILIHCIINIFLVHTHMWVDARIIF